VASAKCLVSADDEGFTYNHKVNRLSAIQEHFMILRAIKSGVSEERIARSLDVDVASIRQKRDLLDGICPEAVQPLRDRKTTGPALREMRKVLPLRQVEIAELMCAAGNYSVGYAAAWWRRLRRGCWPRARGARRRRRACRPRRWPAWRQELESLGREFRLVEESHGKDVSNLVIVVGYLRKLLENARVLRHLGQHHPRS